MLAVENEILGALDHWLGAGVRAADSDLYDGGFWNPELPTEVCEQPGLLGLLETVAETVIPLREFPYCSDAGYCWFSFLSH